MWKMGEIREKRRGMSTYFSEESFALSDVFCFICAHFTVRDLVNFMVLERVFDFQTSLFH
jgi:phage gp29-like protein